MSDNKDTKAKERIEQLLRTPKPPRPTSPQVVINAQNCAFNIWQNTGEGDQHETAKGI